MDVRNPLRHTALLFDGHADGQWTLPDDVLAARDDLSRVEQMQKDLPGPPEHPHSVRDRLAYLVSTGATLDVTPVFDAQRAIDEREERLALLTAARSMASSRLVTVIADRAGQIITDHLAPAFDDLVAKLSADFAATGHLDAQSRPAVLLSQPKPVRDALIRIDTNVNRYRVVRQAASIARKLRQTPSVDSRGYFAEVRNTEQVWRQILSAGFAPTTAPWPADDTRARLAWLFAHDAKLWLPTTEQQDARYLEVFGERIERAEANRSHLNAYRAMFGSVA